MAKDVSKTILIIDDNPFMVEILANELKNSGFNIEKADSGEKGIKKIKDSKPSLLILDMPLPDKADGFKTLKEIKENSKDLPILIVSNNDTVEFRKKVLEEGVNGYLIKAFAGKDEVIQAVNEIMAGKVIMPSMEEQPASEKTKDESGESEGKDENKIKYKSPFSSTSINIGVPPKIKAKIEKALVSPRAELSIINLVNDLIEYAYHARASDIHLEPYSDRFIARMRIDGILHDVFSLPKNTQSEIIARIKVLAGMRTDEHQTAQDGRFKATIKSPPKQFDIRVSIVPTYYGENSVLRLLAEQSSIKTIEDLAFSPEDKERIKRAIKKPYGMILVTGPTGSGKSTTLYTVIRELNKRSVSIITIEDPVEYSVEGIDQIQVNTRTGLTFATGLRSILRQDPNVIMVGEIRDKETASIAVNAALTGHKLLSTLHTNDAATTLPRLLDMEVEPFLIASTVNVVIGQRLVRMLCTKCKKKRKMTETELKNLTKSIPEKILGNHKEFYEVGGCEVCGDTGYFDRMGIYEILEMNDEIRSAILRRADSSEINEIATKSGMSTLLEDGFKKVVSGLTTIEELLRVVKE
ncbi:MAG: hypothetical protein COV29_03805 [Candidatus Yanofskybacteria bacterium CG10_big_fil_rev_8_21_14_0_10_36_16]|uniref:Response regulatory domain-containing protein n=1 Tax=Candidatus Yanofskybacteria bacterium CG10_big_fil_rev_8_21_14_0_10_36_16 TaxID=1975096 RepID=A0A2J0Q6L6_9BACT|nr:MAG: hypothetical protein COV29_03805 [Candidatus Yanofskybacteria bacterium CG10_big_fil_rev_8_21_14_0_10_36_16]